MKEMIKLAYRILEEEHSRKKELFPKGPSQEYASCVLAKKTNKQGSIELQCNE